MAALKTRKNDADVEAFIAAVEHPQRRADSLQLLEIMRALTGEQGAMWGGSIIGFGAYHYVYDSGREDDWMRVGFSPRKRQLVLYIMTGFASHDALMARLGKHKTGKSCLYINKLADIDLDVLRALITASLEHLEEKYPAA